MKKYFTHLPLFFIPFLIMIGVNEYCRFVLPQSSYRKNGIKTINRSEKMLLKCTWNCHNQTTYCIQNHNNTKMQYYIGELYNGIVQFLSVGGKYKLSNIIFLVILWPLGIYIMFVKVLSNHKKINQQKKY